MMKKAPRSRITVLASVLLLLSPAFGDPLRAADFDPQKTRTEAENGNAQAQYELGKRYVKGEGVPRDYAIGRGWLRKAAEQGNAAAENDLGTVYAKGQGVDADFVVANQWFLKGAKHGDSLAQYNLATSLELGRGAATVNLTGAIVWYRKAADQGMPEAENRLGEMYHAGEGVPRDYQEAVKWFRKAADHGLPMAELNLGGCYESGHGVELDQREAERWFLKAAEDGNAKAQFNTGMAYRRNGALGVDLAEAYCWLTLSGQNGFSAGFAQRAELLKEGLITRKQIADGNRLVSEYRARHAAPNP